tara:strand:- start:3868 stop:4152 length:285 start_codon:yes stop_codon:yes gene_type:complete
MAEKKIPAAKTDSTIPNNSLPSVMALRTPIVKNRHEIKLSHNEALISLLKTGHTKATKIKVTPIAPVRVAGGVSNHNPEMRNAIRLIKEIRKKL